MSRGTPDSACCLPISNTGLSPSPAGLSRTVLLSSGSRYAVHYPETHALQFRLFPFRSPLLRKSMFLSLPPGT